MSIYPVQTRAVDPYAEYNSNVVNRLTRTVTKGTNCLDSLSSLDVIQDLINPEDHVNITSGQCYKDDVLIQVTEDMNVDMTDFLFYPQASVPFNEAGYYYFLLSYTYVKSKPSPQASIRILKPSQRGLFNTNSFIFLKAVQIIFNGATFEIDSFYDHDPENPTVKRIYTPLFHKFIYTISSWVPSGSFFYHDVSIESLHSKDTSITCINNVTDHIIYPKDIEFLDEDTVRIWMPVNTVNVRVIVV